MAATRSKTGNSKPRIVAKVEEAASAAAPKRKGAPKKRAPAATAKKPAAATKTKANTSKPRAKKGVASGKVVKPSAGTPKTKKAKAPVAKKVKAAVDKAVDPAVDTKGEPTVLEKIEGIAMKVQGAITGSTGKKAAGTAKIRGTDSSKKAAPKKSKA